jgi:hypothetical protein
VAVVFGNDHDFTRRVGEMPEYLARSITGTSAPRRLTIPPPKAACRGRRDGGRPHHLANLEDVDAIGFPATSTLIDPKEKEQDSSLLVPANLVLASIFFNSSDIVFLSHAAAIHRCVAGLQPRDTTAMKLTP